MLRKNSFPLPTLLLVTILIGCSTARANTESAVRVWEEPLVIPTYQVGPPDPNPRFYAGRAYQGAQGRVYPYPMLDRLTDTREDKAYNAVYLENEYVRICVLPEIGGRIFAGLDKTNDYDFFYRQHVIKPALVGMLGAWISGGIEWNVPHHHRASAFMPVAHTLQADPDGSKTVWIGEIELRHRTKWLIGMTLHPGKSYLELTVKVFNRTPLATSFLYWANIAVHANEDYQVIFPPSTEYATYHGKNAFARWPISHEVYRGIDYSKGVDLSWWKNHPRPISFFAWNCQEDFLAGYDHGRQAGVVHVANHHLVPGKKLWEWSPGPQGRMWDKILTDADGPYVELMVGAYSDNQPDYSWLQPYEVKIIKEYWYPIRQLGDLKNANVNGAVSLQVRPNNTARIAFNTTSRHTNARVLLVAQDRPLCDVETDIAPDTPFFSELKLPALVNEEDLRLSLLSSTGDELIGYKPARPGGAPMPDVVTPPPPPEDIGTVEELYLTGLRLEQFYNPALEPYPYYEEALRRDPGDYRVNLALGILYLKRGLFERAADTFRTALTRATRGYTAPRDGEAYYYLGLALRGQGDWDGAYDALYRATWSHAFHTAAYYQLAEINCRRGDLSTALEHVNRSIATNAWNTKALNLKCAVLRHGGRLEEAAALAARVLALDPLDLWAAHELCLANRDSKGEAQSDAAIDTLAGKLRDDVQHGLEIAVDYGNCGLWDEAINVLALLLAGDTDEASRCPMVHYYMGYLWQAKGEPEKARGYYRSGAKMPPEYCFPHRLESINVLRAASKANPGDARAPYYLGNLLYDHQPRNAIREWEASRALDDTFATVHRNLGIAYTQVENDTRKGHTCLEKAIACDEEDPRLFYELDVLSEAVGISPTKRLEVLQRNHATIADHNDALSREVVLLTQLGYYDEAIELMNTHHFRKWEGVGNIHNTYLDTHLLRARRHCTAGRYREAVKDYEAALEYPENLEVARPYDGGRSCQVYFLMGEAYEAAGDAGNARRCYEEAAAAKLQGGWSERCYYQGLALRKVGEEERAGRIFDELVRAGKKRLEAGASMEFFAKFGEQLRRERRMANAHYLMALGYMGEGEKEQAKVECEKALELDANHLWAGIHVSDLK